MIAIDKQSNGSKIVAQKGDVIKVQLPENPTTGYMWKIKSLDSNHLQNKDEKYDTSGGGIGAGGMKIFFIEIIEKGTTDLQVALENTWENATEDTFTVTIES